MSHDHSEYVRFKCASDVNTMCSLGCRSVTLRYVSVAGAAEFPLAGQTYLCFSRYPLRPPPPAAMFSSKLKKWTDFYIAPQSYLCKRCICYGKSLRPRVCPSHSGIVSKRGNAEGCGLYHLVALVFWCQEWLLGDDPV